MTEKRGSVVTGASRGVGKGIAVALGASGMVVYTDDAGASGLTMWRRSWECR